MDAAEHHVRRGRQAADLVGLGSAVQAPDLRAHGFVAAGLLDLIGDSRYLERLRRAMVDLRSLRDETQDDQFRFGRVRRPDRSDAVSFEGGGCPRHPPLTR